MEEKETLQEIVKWELENITSRYGDIIDAMAEVGYLIHTIKNGTKTDDEELLKAQNTITEPLILYRQLLEQLTKKA